MTGRVSARGALAAGLAALAALAPACGSGTTQGTAATTTVVEGGAATSAGPFLASYSRTGGLAGRRFEVVVRPDGTFEGGSGNGGRGHLGGGALDELRRLVAEFVAARPAGRYGDAHPDVLGTTVVAGDTATTVLTGGEPPRPVQALISFLAGLERQLPR